MIRPPGFRGAAFGRATEGNLLEDSDARRRVSDDLGIPPDWASVSQVHGAKVQAVTGPGPAGEGDVLVTTTPDMPLAVRTADCVPLIMESAAAVAVVHAGWRGLAVGVVAEGAAALQQMDDVPLRAAMGPAIGPCCYDVGDEVAERFPEFVERSRHGGTSVNLWRAAAAQLGDLEVWNAAVCTSCDGAFFSHRRDDDGRRQVAVGWI